jgi:hypothetical protein
MRTVGRKIQRRNLYLQVLLEKSKERGAAGRPSSSMVRIMVRGFNHHYPSNFSLLADTSTSSSHDDGQTLSLHSNIGGAAA